MRGILSVSMSVYNMYIVCSEAKWGHLIPWYSSHSCELPWGAETQTWSSGRAVSALNWVISSPEGFSFFVFVLLKKDGSDILVWLTLQLPFLWTATAAIILYPSWHVSWSMKYNTKGSIIVLVYNIVINNLSHPPKFPCNPFVVILDFSWRMLCLVVVLVGQESQDPFKSIFQDLVFIIKFIFYLSVAH